MVAGPAGEARWEGAMAADWLLALGTLLGGVGALLVGGVAVWAAMPRRRRMKPPVDPQSLSEMAEQARKKEGR